VLHYNFIETPDVSVIKNAVEMLVVVKIINDDGNTTSREKILAMLPVYPQLGKVLLDGCEAAIGSETAIAVAMSATSVAFVRIGTDAEKETCDKKRLQFCHEDVTN